MLDALGRFDTEGTQRGRRRSAAAAFDEELVAADRTSPIDLNRITAPALDLPDVATEGLFTPGQRRTEPAPVGPYEIGQVPIGQVPDERRRGQSDVEFARTLFGDVAASEAGPSFGSRITDLASSAGHLVTRGGQAVWRSTLAAGRRVRRGLERRHQAQLRAALHPVARPQRNRTRRSSRRARIGWQELAVVTLALAGIAEVAWLTLEFTKPPDAPLATPAPAAASASLAPRTPATSGAAKVGTAGARPVHAQPPAAARSDVTVTAAIPLDVIEDGRRIASGRNPKLALSPGEHHLEFSNSGLGFHETRTVDVPASGAASINLAMAPGTVDVNAAPWASVQIDGRPVGDTPLGKIEVSAGSHEVVFTHPELGERTVKVVVPPGNAVRVTADLRKAR
jgi:hypothetical protein